jgi:fructooligosaccharide transport system substrate-binding protein
MQPVDTYLYAITKKGENLEMKKALILILSVLVVLSVSACSSTTGGKAASQGDNSQVTMWVQMSSDTAEGKAIQKDVDRFNAQNKGKYHATIQFIPRSNSGGGYEDKVNAALTTGTLPDVLTLDGPNTAAYAKSGIIAPIDQYISNKSDFLPSIIKQGTYNGKLYAIGYSESGVGVFYNKKMLKDAGIDLASLPTIDHPWDWNQFEQLCQKLVAKYHQPAIDMQLNSKDEWLTYAFLPFLWSQGGEVANGNKAMGVFNSTAAVKTMGFIQDMVKKGYTTNTPIDKGFQTGKYPMYLSGSWTIQELDSSYKNIDYGIMPYPTSPDTQQLVSPSGSWQYAMSATTKKTAAAGALIHFLTTTPSLAQVDLDNSVLPPAKSVMQYMKGKVSPQMQFLIDQNAKTAHPRPILPEYPQVSKIFQDTISDATYYKQNSDVQKLMDNQAQLMQNALQQ